MGVQPHVLAGDEKPVQHRRGVPAPHLDQQLGEVGDEELDIGVPVAKHSHEVEALARAAGPSPCDHRVLEQDILEAIGQRIEPEMGLVERLLA